MKRGITLLTIALCIAVATPVKADMSDLEVVQALESVSKYLNQPNTCKDKRSCVLPLFCKEEKPTEDRKNASLSITAYDQVMMIAGPGDRIEFTIIPPYSEVPTNMFAYAMNGEISTLITDGADLRALFAEEVRQAYNCAKSKFLEDRA